MQQELQTIGIQEMFKYASEVGDAHLGQDFIIGRANGSRAFEDGRLLKMLHYPIRLDGYIVFFLKKGRFRISFNLHSYNVQENSLLITVPGNIIQIDSFNEAGLEDTDIAYVVLSRDFISGLHVDFNTSFQNSVRMLETPCVVLNEEQLALAESYFNLAQQVALSSQRNKKQILSGLLSSLSYLTDDVWTEQLQGSSELRERNTNRANQVYEQFMKLVAQYHNSQRNMAFYADRMCLTPKYLSKIVKEASGRSGPEWIDAYVILEAKNLLRYSDAPIKEIVYTLHFPNSSVFHKFFKLHAGVSPSDYRKGK